MYVSHFMFQMNMSRVLKRAQKSLCSFPCLRSKRHGLFPAYIVFSRRQSNVLNPCSLPSRQLSSFAVRATRSAPRSATTALGFPTTQVLDAPAVHVVLVSLACARPPKAPASHLARSTFRFRLCLSRFCFWRSSWLCTSRHCALVSKSLKHGFVSCSKCFL